MRKRFRMSLGTKNAMMIVVVAILLTCVALSISYTVFAQETDSYYTRLAHNLSRTGTSYIDGDIINEYINGREPDAAYQSMLDNLYKLKENNDILYLYVEKLTTANATTIMDTDLSETSFRLGDQQPIHPNFVPTAERMLAGEEITPTITNSKYGWLVTTYAPIRDSQGNIVAHLGVDISMDDIMKARRDFVLMLVFALSAGAALCILIMVQISKRTLVNPVNLIAKAADSYVTEKSSGSHPEKTSAELFEIRTGDEIENLAKAVLQMEQDINTYIRDLTFVTAEKERVSVELNLATRIQAGLLPRVFPPYPDNPFFDIYASMQPAKEIGGDFYDFFMVNDDQVALVIADVSGKGIPAALFMMMSKTMIKNYIQSGMSIVEAFKTSNNSLCENNEGGLFVTAWLAVITLSTGVMQWVNAGHNRPLLSRAGAPYVELDQHSGFVLAGLEDTIYRSQEVTLGPGDRVYVYTDGVNEATNAQNEMYGDARLIATLSHTGAEPIKGVVQSVQTDIDAFVKDAPQFDDITMLVFEYVGISKSNKV